MKSGILNHVWGVSLASDRVWAQVNGLAPKEAGRRLLLVLQAYIDESEDSNGVLVMGGYIASAQSWVNFTHEWRKLLDAKFGIMHDSGYQHFKMSEMAKNPERMNRLPLFFKVIEDNVLGWISAKLDRKDLERAISRIVVPSIKVDYDKYRNPWFFLFQLLDHKFHKNYAEISKTVPFEDKIDFIFDNRAEKKHIIETWCEYIENRPPEEKKYYGATPRFEDDADFLPLQAADFWVWWVRKWYVEKTPEKIRPCDFENFGFNKNKKYLRIEISFTEEDLVKILMRMLRKQIGSDHVIYDAGRGLS